jgi:hypothetical protein
MWKICAALKAILSNQGFNTNHLFQKIDYLENKIDILNSHLTSTQNLENRFPNKNTSLTVNDNKYENIENIDILERVIDIKKRISQIKNQQGIPSSAHITFKEKNDVDIYDITHEVWQVDAGISELKLRLDIHKQAVKPLRVEDKSHSDIYQKLLIIEEKIVALSGYILHANTRTH